MVLSPFNREISYEILVDEKVKALFCSIILSGYAEKCAVFDSEPFSLFDH